MVVSHSLFMTSWNEWLEDAMIFSSSQCGESDRQAVGSLSVMPRVHSYMALFRAEAVGCWMDCVLPSMTMKGCALVPWIRHPPLPLPPRY